MTGQTSAPGTAIPVRTLPNLRELGGYRVRDGRQVKRGQLYRSVLLARLSDSDLDLVKDLGVRTVIDFRTAAEHEANPDRDLGARELGLDVLADRTGSGPAALLAKMDDPVAINEALSDGQGHEMMRQAYTELIELPSANKAFGTFFEEVAAADSLPLLFHCTTGKDRTGWAAAATLLFLGASEEDVFHDYLLTNEHLLPALKPYFDQFEAVGGDVAVLRPVLSVDADYLRTAIDLMNSEYGSIDGYMRDGLGLDEDVLESLRNRLLTSG